MPTITGTTGNDLIIGSDGDDDIFGLTGNDTIQGGTGVDIIDAGAGDDVISGEGGADILTGGTGVDRFRDTAAGLNGDRITDLLPGDRIQLTDLTLQNANIAIVGSTITYNGGSVTIDNLGPGRLFIRAIQTGGVEIRLQQNAKSDFDGDGRSDVLWRNDNGWFTSWTSNASGGFTSNDANHFHSIPTSWQVVGTGDFNGDGRADVVWRNTNGSFTNWLSQANGTFSSNDANAFEVVPTSWHVDGVGDFNGDARDDLIWRNDNGTFTTWLAQPDGGFVSNDANSLTVLPTNWKVADTGDFNGDGRDDIIWRRDDGAFTTWLSQPNGSFVSNDTNSWALVPTNWVVEATGDFNGDGSDDIVWRRDDGAFTTWLSQGNGSFVSNDANSWAVIPTTWQVIETGDYNGDGRDDILWRRADGALTNWLSQPNGSFVSNDLNAFAVIPNAWHIQGPDTYFWQG
jgi:hypothetical protein